MKKKHFYWVVPILIATTAISLLLFVHKKEKDQEITEEKTKQAPEIQPVTEWSIYINQEHGFTFKYPEEWEKKEVSVNYILVKYHHPDEKGNIDQADLSLRVIDNTAKMTLADWVAKHDPINPDTMELVAQSTREIDGQPGILREITDNVAGGQINDLHITYQDKIYQFELTARASKLPEQAEYRLILNQILASFKFN
ncbi:hypothetical protein KJ903_05235 [Patescibacteria group bacterium]|nr:hypothetical protein [Patescibacteria group bacterium]